MSIMPLYIHVPIIILFVALSEIWVGSALVAVVSVAVVQSRPEPARARAKKNWLAQKDNPDYARPNLTLAIQQRLDSPNATTVSTQGLIVVKIAPVRTTRDDEIFTPALCLLLE